MMRVEAILDLERIWIFLLWVVRAKKGGFCVGVRGLGGWVVVVVAFGGVVVVAFCYILLDYLFPSTS